MDLNTESIRDEKVKVLRSLRVEKGDIVRGQYGAGVVDDRQVLAYNQEVNVSSQSNVETFAALKVHVDNFVGPGYLFTCVQVNEWPTNIQAL